MANATPVNVDAFAANHLRKVGRATSGDISVGSMITQIAIYFGYNLVEMNHAPVTSKIGRASCRERV